MDNMMYTIIGLLTTLFVIIVVYIVQSIIQIRHDREMDIEDLELETSRLGLESKKLDIEAEIDESSFGLLDIVVQKNIDDYLIMNPKFLEAEYINTELQNEMNRGICNKVADRLSPALLNKFSMIYNMDKFTDILAEKVYIRTLYIVVERNKMKK